MNGSISAKPQKEVKKKISGWIIALIVIVVVFATGAILCNTIGKAQSPQKPSTQQIDDTQEN